MLPREASMVKLFVTETAKRAALEGMKLMGLLVRTAYAASREH
jgi:alkylation response protein AidB-like acyl-CoA dehydrogenase